MPTKNARIEFTNAFMFGRVMGDEAICRGVLENILGFEIGRIEYQNAEQEIEPMLGAKGVKLDVMAKADGKVFDVEMQVCPEPDLAKRARYYQGAIDVSTLKKGDTYAMLPDSYIIFICTRDFLGVGAVRYDIEMGCRLHPDAQYDSGAHVIVLNASAWKDGECDDPAGLLEYVATGADTGSKLVRDIIRAVNDANNDSEWVSNTMGIMTLDHDLRNAKYVAEKLASELEDATTINEQLSAEIGNVKAASNKMAAELDDTKAENEKLAAKLDESKAASNKMAAELDDTKAENEKLAAELDESKAEGDRLAALAKVLNGMGRGSEYFDALEDADLMKRLLAEFEL